MEPTGYYGGNIIDLHVHTMVNDKNSNITVVQLEALYEVNKKPFIVVDSGFLNKWLYKPNFILLGREVSVPCSAFKGQLSSEGYADFLVLGWEEDYKNVDKETGIFNGDLDLFFSIYKKKETALILAHPTRNFIYLDHIGLLPREIEETAKMADAIEAFNAKDEEYHFMMNYALGTKLNKCMTAGSDATYANKTYMEVTEFKNYVSTISQIVEAIKNKEARPYMSQIRMQKIASYMGIDLETKKQRKPSTRNRRLIE